MVCLQLVPRLPALEKHSGGLDFHPTLGDSSKLEFECINQKLSRYVPIEEVIFSEKVLNASRSTINTLLA